jgi:hypothetical protein
LLHQIAFIAWQVVVNRLLDHAGYLFDALPLCLGVASVRSRSNSGSSGNNNSTPTTARDTNRRQRDADQREHDRGRSETTQLRVQHDERANHHYRDPQHTRQADAWRGMISKAQREPPRRTF